MEAADNNGSPDSDISRFRLADMLVHESPDVAFRMLAAFGKRTDMLATDHEAWPNDAYDVRASEALASGRMIPADGLDVYRILFEAVEYHAAQTNAILRSHRVPHGWASV